MESIQVGSIAEEAIELLAFGLERLLDDNKKRIAGKTQGGFIAATRSPA